MGKRSRHRARVVKAAEPPPAAVDPAPTGLHITVAAITDLHELDLRHETELVKSALLYADRVTLASPKVALMASIAGVATLDRRQRIDAMAELIGVLDTGQDAVRLYSDLRRRRQRLSPHERKLLAGMESRLDSSSQDVMAQVDQLLEQAGAGELARALELGLVELHGLGMEQADARNLTDVVIEALADVLAESVGAAARTFPLFDNDAGDLMRAMVAEGKVVEPRTARSKEAGAAGRLIAGIDAFPSAAMDDLIDVRQQLARATAFSATGRSLATPNSTTARGLPTTCSRSSAITASRRSTPNSAWRSRPTRSRRPPSCAARWRRAPSSKTAKAGRCGR